MLQSGVMNQSCIRLRGLTKTFSAADPTLDMVRAVDDINLDISAGEIVALLGPNGAGKTTTLDMILGFTSPTSGEVQVFGQLPRDAILDSRIAAVLQTGGLLRDLTVRETIELIASTHGNPKPIDSVIGRAGLGSVERQRVQSCSGGEQQRLRFALALLGDPDLLVLDEPTTGMDVQARQEFWAAMRAEADEGRTVVFATHYLQEAEDFAERTVLMANGKVVADGPTGDVRAQASGRRVKARFDGATHMAVIGELNDLAIVHAVVSQNDFLLIETSDSDELARHILGPLGGSDLEIEAASLENAFIQLTAAGA